MPELDKVISGLKACLEYPDRCTGDCTTDLCPYHGDDCNIGLLNDALALLKAQQPKVLTLEEALDSEDEYWLEGINGACGYGCVIIDVNLKYVFCSTNSIRGRYVDPDAYNKTWRCWNIKPTDEQRKEMEWKQ